MGWGYGWGWGWNPLCGVDKILFATSSEGTLFIDLIDAKKKELVWQGEGISYLNQNRGDKEKRINEFVAAILKQYPPQTK
jgi:hypothetical protein